MTLPEVRSHVTCACVCLSPLAARVCVCVCVWQPFVGDDHAIQAWFPNRELAIAIPAVLLVLLVTLASAFVGWVMVKKARKKKKQ